MVSDCLGLNVTPEQVGAEGNWWLAALSSDNPIRLMMSPTANVPHAIDRSVCRGVFEMSEAKEAVMPSYAARLNNSATHCCKVHAADDPPFAETPIWVAAVVELNPDDTACPW